MGVAGGRGGKETLAVNPRNLNNLFAHKRGFWLVRRGIPLINNHQSKQHISFECIASRVRRNEEFTVWINDSLNP